MALPMYTLLQNALRRPTAANRPWLRELDGLRFLAILAVVLQHLMERFARHTSLRLPQPVSDDPFAFFISRGTVGVFLFFAISAFIVSLPFAKYQLQKGARPKLRDFYLRRLTRLEAPYIIWMGVFALLLLVKGSFKTADLLPHFLANLTYTHGFIYGGHSPINPVAWSLEVEIQFYLLAPFLVSFFFGIRSKVWRRLALLASLFIWILLQARFGWLFFPWKLSLLGQLPHFLVGLLVADFYLNEWQTRPTTTFYWDLLAPLAYVTMCYTWTTEPWKNLVFALALFVLMAAAFRGQLFKKMLQHTWVAVTGGMCYTIYLIHLPLLEGLAHLTNAVQVGPRLWVNFLLQAAIALPLVWFASAVFFGLIEKPFMRLGIADLQVRVHRSFHWIKVCFNPVLYKNGLFTLFLWFAASTANGQVSPPLVTNDTLRLQPLENLLQHALERAPALDANQTDVAKQMLAVSVQRNSWADVFTMSGTAYYGNGVVNEIRSVAGADLDYATGRLGKGINLTLGVKLTGSDLTSRRQKNKIQVLQLDRLQQERQMLVDEIRAEVTEQYFALENVLQAIRLRAETLETLRMARTVADKYFKEGNLPIGEYTNLLLQETAAQEAFLKTQNEAKQRVALLENLTGATIWKG